MVDRRVGRRQSPADLSPSDSDHGAFDPLEGRFVGGRIRHGSDNYPMIRCAGQLSVLYIYLLNTYNPVRQTTRSHRGTTTTHRLLAEAPRRIDRPALRRDIEPLVSGPSPVAGHQPLERLPPLEGGSRGGTRTLRSPNR